MPGDILTPEDLPLEPGSGPDPKVQKRIKLLGILLNNEEQARAELGDEYDSVVELVRSRVAQDVKGMQSPMPDWHEGSRQERDASVMSEPPGVPRAVAAGAKRAQEVFSDVGINPEKQPTKNHAPGAERVQKAAAEAGIPQETQPLKTGDVEGKTVSSDELADEELAFQKEYQKGFFQPKDKEYGLSASNSKELFTPPQTSVDGVAHWWTEPSLEQFQRDMGPSLVEGGRRVTEQSKVFREYADQKWKEAHDEAQARGIKLKRVEYSPEVYSPGFAKAAGSLSSAAYGLDRTALLGIGSGLTRVLQKMNESRLLHRPTIDQFRSGDSIEEIRNKIRAEQNKSGSENVISAGEEITARHPTAAAVGEVAGTLAPMGAANLAGRFALGGASKVPGAAQLLARSPALEGALAGAAGTSALEAGTQASDVAMGKRTAFESPRIAEAALGGGLFGGGLGAIMGGAGRGRRAIEADRELGPKLKEAGRIGARTSLRPLSGGMTTPPAVKALRQRATRGSRGRTDEELLQAELEPGVTRAVQENVDRYGTTAERLSQEVIDYGSDAAARYNKLVRDIEKAVAKGGREEYSAAVKAAEKEKEAFYKTPEGKERHSLEPLANAWAKFFKARTDKSGHATSSPVALENRELFPLAESAWEAAPAAANAGEARALAQRIGGTPVTLAKARKYGIDVDKAIESRAKGFVEENNPGLGSEAFNAELAKVRIQFNKTGRIVLVPKYLDARGIDNHIQSMRRELIREDLRGGKGQVDIPQLKIVEEGMYKVRDQVKAPPGSDAKDWSEANHRISDALSKAQDRLEYSGLPRKGVGEKLAAGEEQRLRNAIQSVGTGKNPVAEDAVHRLARTGRGEPQLNEAVRLRAESADLGLELPAPERITEDAVNKVRGRVAAYSKGSPNESLERVLHGRGQLPQLQLLPETRQQLRVLGFEPETGATPSGVQSLLKGYRGGQQPGPTEQAFEELMQGRPEADQLQLLRGLKALNELRSAGKLSLPARLVGGGGGGPRVYGTVSPKAAPLKLRAHAGLRGIEEMNPAGPSAELQSRFPVSGLWSEESEKKPKEKSKMKPEKRRQLLRLQRALTPGAL